MENFLKFLFAKTYIKKPQYEAHHLKTAIEKTIADIKYHYPDMSSAEIINRIKTNQSELPILLYRLGHAIKMEYPDSNAIPALHWIMRECCSCEIYFSNTIDTGLYITHGLGTVIGSRNRIAKGFRISQGCTIGRKNIGENAKGSIIGSNVIVYANSQIIGELRIGKNVIIGSHSIVLNDVPDNMVFTGVPAKKIRRREIPNEPLP